MDMIKKITGAANNNKVILVASLLFIILVIANRFRYIGIRDGK